MLLVLPHMQLGILVLFYNTSYYVQRGGDSSGDAYCGIFSVFAYVNDSSARWYYGAALSFKFIASYYYSYRGGNSGHGTFCGVFSVIVGNAASYDSWGTGAVL